MTCLQGESSTLRRHVTYPVKNFNISVLCDFMMFILETNMKTTPPQRVGYKMVAMATPVPSNGATKSAFYDGIFQKLKGP